MARAPQVKSITPTGNETTGRSNSLVIPLLLLRYFRRHNLLDDEITESHPLWLPLIQDVSPCNAHLYCDAVSPGKQGHGIPKCPLPGD